VAPFLMLREQRAELPRFLGSQLHDRNCTTTLIAMQGLFDGVVRQTPQEWYPSNPVE
jgi:hypothetical protein